MNGIFHFKSRNPVRPLRQIAMGSVLNGKVAIMVIIIKGASAVVKLVASSRPRIKRKGSVTPYDLWPMKNLQIVVETPPPDAMVHHWQK